MEVAKIGLLCRYRKLSIVVFNFIHFVSYRYFSDQLYGIICKYRVGSSLFENTAALNGGSTGITRKVFQLKPHGDR